MYKDTKKRTIIKTIGFKLVTTSFTALFTGLGDAIIIHIVLTLFYLIYERVWTNIQWGKHQDPKQHSIVKR